MDWKTFVVNIINSVAWPFSIIVIVLLLYKPIKTLFEERLDSLNYKDISLKFSKGVEKLQKITPKTAYNITESTIQNSSISFTELTKSAPETSILYVWTIIEEHLARKAEELNLSKYEILDIYKPSRIMAVLAEIEAIDPSAYSIFEQLSNLRNVTAHQDNKLSYKDTSDFVKYAEILLSMIDNAALIQN